MLCNYEEFEFLDRATNTVRKLYRPILRVNIIKRGLPMFALDCLLDSGADMIIFPADLAADLGVQYNMGHRVESSVAGGGSIGLYELPFEKHGISIFVDDIHVREKFLFSEGQKMPLLGEEFFKYFKIIFDRENKQFSLEP